jgi:protein associated with RNAse G/E
MKEYWFNVYPDILCIRPSDGGYIYMEYDSKFNAEYTATNYRLYRIHVKLK